MSLVRTFVAVELSPGICSQAARLTERLKVADAKVNWVATDNMHLTLKFLGEVPLDATAEICRRMASAVVGTPPIQLRICGLGAFPNTDRPRTLWLGVTEGANQLAELQRAVEESLAEMGFPIERRKFSAHLTIGRVRGAQNIEALGKLVAAKAEFDAGETEVDEVLVVASYLEKAGPRYEVLGRAALDATVPKP